MANAVSRRRWAPIQTCSSVWSPSWALRQVRIMPSSCLTPTTRSQCSCISYLRPAKNWTSLVWRIRWLWLAPQVAINVPTCRQWRPQVRNNSGGWPRSTTWHYHLPVRRMGSLKRRPARNRSRRPFSRPAKWKTARRCCYLWAVITITHWPGSLYESMRKCIYWQIKLS